MSDSRRDCLGRWRFFWVAAWLWYTRGLGQKLAGTRFSPREAVGITAHIVSLPGFWVLAVSAIIVNSVNYYLADWVPLYLKTSRGFSFAAGNVLSTAVYAGSWVGSVLVGLWVRKLVAWGVALSSAKKWALFLSCILMFSAVVAGLTPYPYMAVGCLALTGMGMAGFMVIYLTLAQDLDPAHVGVTCGLLGGLGNLVYGYLSPYIGRLADLKQSFLTLILIGCLPWLAFLAIYWGIKDSKASIAPN